MTPEETAHIELIERYLDGLLSEQESILVTHRIQQDAHFSELVTQHRLAQELIIDRGLLELKQKIQQGNYGNDGGNNFVLWSLGTLLLLGIGAGGYLFLNSKEVSTSIKVAVQENPVAPVQKTQEAREPIATAVTTPPPSKNTVASPTPPVQSSIAKEPQRIEVLTTTEAPSKTTPQQQPNIPSPLPVKEALVIKEAASNTEITNMGVTSEQEPVNVPQQEEDDQEYRFNPTIGQVWSFPLEAEANAQILILSKNGEAIYKTQITQGQPSDWNGLSNSGSEVPMGSYPFVISYDQGKVVQGYVTVQR
jgi:hypothetical protein